MSKRHASLNVRLNVDAQLLFYNNSWILKTVPDPFVASSSFMNLASNFAWILSNKRICPSHFPLKFVVVFVWKITTVNHTAIRFNMPQTDRHPDQLHVKGSEFFFLRSLPKSCLYDTKIPQTWGQALETVAFQPLFTVVYIDYILNSGDETKVTVKFRK